jgi:mono/diheme cytochrome c family protein
MEERTMRETGDPAGSLGTRGRRTASRTLLLSIWGLLLTAVLAAGALQTKGDERSGSSAAEVARGKYLVTTAGCNDCHTPWKAGPAGLRPDPSRMLSGHPQGVAMPPAPQLAGEQWSWVGAATHTAFAGPWGVSYSPNLTPDQRTGIGSWTAERFVAAMRSGRHMGRSRGVQPPMPWQGIGQMTDEDLRAIYAYLRSIPAIRNRPPDSLVVGISEGTRLAAKS